MHKIKLALIALSLLASTSLASAEDITLWVRTSSGAVLQALADHYNASHADKVNVTQITAEQMVPKLGAAIAGGAAPDGAVLDLIYLPTFAAADSLEDISDFVKSAPYASAMSPSHIRLATYNEKVYGVPALPDASIIAYNTDLFTKAGLDPSKPPASLDEIAADAKKITALGNSTYGFYFVANSGSWLIYDFLPHIWAAGADILSVDGKTATVDTPAMRETIAAYRDMWKAGAIHPTSRSGNGNNAVEAFASGKVGILMTGSYIVNLLTSKYPDVKFAVAPIPGPKNGASSFAGGDTLALMKGIAPAKKKVALDFVNFYMQPDQQVFITQESGMPSRTDLAKEAYAKFDPRNLTAYDVLAKARTPYTFSSDELFVSRTGPFVNLIQGAIFGDDVNGSIAKTQDDFTKILKRTNPN
ncbi:MULTISPECIES: ABC transporter substrate-binding protein [unclassified Rhizobium]|uniref:ABC transporter substrate-binding protein n=1 Tax=unclassified Rhizobium TaxID=2613769 RepID=UPI001ADCC027|nr:MULTISPECIES: sugar ABC transporter substrate-binding protein [unclassified Rhizobium]MBO9101277.1 sugar ABC transporter substrate-binding protein [Rhizobium sp. L58/93]MBO9171836.1 sugar ABC transporter substrate-binding protein [Rhizobium sp. L245/93]MBO9182717.1 sugar ABC transporter substrate-binding protein [Rhizobium sp. E27B/91]QXZ86426.1 sugar ABC transporter substrate-binding protein [Rhizobium sp. K1/93]QXZ92119.1 sugar ABC transporter substrate-binding protein [Rhizobium sp. K15/